MAKVAIIMGSKSDLEIMRKAETFLSEQNIYCEVFIASAHRTPKKVQGICERIETEFDVVIAGAGMAAHLPGVVAAYTTKPIIGVPIDSSPIQGMDSLLSIVQMPPGIPVATVAVNGAKNAGILAFQILSLTDPSLRQQFAQFRVTQTEQAENVVVS